MMGQTIAEHLNEGAELTKAKHEKLQRRATALDVADYYVRFGHLADIALAPTNVRFWGKADIRTWYCARTTGLTDKRQCVVPGF